MPLSFFTNAGTSYGSAVPFQRIVEPSQLGLFLNLEQAELLRIQRYNEAWRFYFGKHWAFTREDGEPLVTLNYFRKFIDKITEFMVNKGFVITTHDALSETSRPYLDEVWGYNSRDALVWDIGTTGAVTGDVFVLITDEEPTDIQKKINPFSQGKTRINLLGSEQVFPTWDPLNVDTLVAARIETIYYADRERLPEANDQGRQLHTKRFTQLITATHIVEQFHGEQPVVKENALGEIPLVHIKNISVPKEYYGLSDGQDLTDLNRELNEKSTDISDTINYHASPITVITGAKAKNLERGPRQIWSGLPADAQVFNLRLEGDLNASQTYWDKIKRSMHEIGDVPEGVMGQMQPISNTSGVALHIQFQPILGRVRRKRILYELGMEKINYYILRIGMITGRISLPYDICSRCGGRILEAPTGRTVPVWSEEMQDYVDVDQTKKRCFLIDKQTMDFMHPEEVKIKIWREYGFGGEVREVPLSEAERIAAGARSFWDYAYVNKDEQDKYEQQIRDVGDQVFQAQLDLFNRGPQNEGTQEGAPAQQTVVPNPIPPKPVPKVQRLPIGEIQVPEEPVRIKVVEPLMHPRTGAVIRTIDRELFLVPTGCKVPTYLNPYENTVTFNDVLPKDEALQAQLFEKYQMNGWVDEEWVQARIPEIAGEMQEINKRLKAKASSGMPQPAGAAMKPAPKAQPPVIELAPPEQPLASVPGRGGNPVPPGKSEM